MLPGPAPSATISDAEWAKIVEAAKKEGNVTCYCWAFSSWQDKWLRDAFKADTGITVELLRFSGTVSVERIKSEARAGKYFDDVFNAMLPYHLGGGGLGGTGLLSKSIDILPALQDAKDPTVWYFNPINSSETLSQPFGVMIPGGNFRVNTNIVSPERMPKKLTDLRDPWWKGKICEIDPLTASVTDSVLWRYYRGLNGAEWWPDMFYDLYNKNNSYAFFTILGAPEPLITGSCAITPRYDGVSAGLVKDYQVAQKAPWITAGSFTEPPLIPIAGATAQGFSVLAQAPHPNAALLLINWLFSQQGQESWAKQGYGRAARRAVGFYVEPQYNPLSIVDSYWDPENEWEAFIQYSYNTKGLFNLEKQGMSRDAWRKWVKDTSTTFWGRPTPPPPPSGFYSMSTKTGQ